VDREAITRGVRRQQVEEALEFEREREETLEQQLAFAIAEVEGPRIDAAIFASLSPEAAKIVGDELNPLPFDADEEPDFFERDDLIDFDDEGPVDPHAEEVARLNDELGRCRRRQDAFRAYLAALDELPSASSESPG
jgi:hypothetical protein